MPPQPNPMTIEETVDRLYGLPLAEFTSARNQAASELRKAGHREAAERVRRLAKPTAAAAAVNRLVREHRGEIERFLRAADVLRDAQFAGKGDLAAATRHEREELERLVGTGGEVVRQTLLAAAADEDAASELLDAQLVRELELRGFGTLLARMRPDVARPTGAAAAHAKPVSPKKAKPDNRAALARLDGARASLDTAQAAERRARSRREQTQDELQKAQAAVENARRDLENARRDLEKAQHGLDNMRAAVDAAQHTLDEAHTAVEKARRDLDNAQTTADEAPRGLR